jgi:Protein of unknown function (DUF1571)
MKRLFFFLPVCMFLAPSYPSEPLTSAHTTQLVSVDKDAKKLPNTPDPEGDVIVFLEYCLKQYDITVTDYSLLFCKQERTGNELNPLEIVEVCYRARPYSVFMRWHQGARLTDRSLFVEGENKDSEGKSQVVARSKLLKKVFHNDPEGVFAKQTSRYPINTFGLRQALARVLQPWKAAKDQGSLHVTYEKLHKVPETGHRTCYKFHRSKFARPEGSDGVQDVIVYIDCETLLLVGSIVKGEQGKLLGEYFFREINLHPTFDAAQFEPATVAK